MNKQFFRKPSSGPSLSKVLKEGFQAAKRNYGLTFLISLILFGSMQAIMSLGMGVIEATAQEDLSQTASIFFSSPLTILSALAAICFFNFGLILNLILIGSSYQKKTYPLDAAFRFSFHIFFRALWANLLCSLLIAVGLIIFNLLGFLAATLLSIVLPLVIFEFSPVFKAIKFSIQRTAHRFTVSAVVAALIWLLTFGSSDLIHFFVAFLSEDHAWILETSFQSLMNALLFPFCQGLTVSLYFNLSRRV
jgi:hypothetical protein